MKCDINRSPGVKDERHLTAIERIKKAKRKI
jgi:hypothetical protein